MVIAPIAPTSAYSAVRSEPIRHLMIGWVLTLPITFFAVGGVFSFEGGNDGASSASSLSGLASTGRHLGFIGHIVVPGIVYSIVLWLILINLNRIISLALNVKLITLLALLAIGSALWSQDAFRSAFNGGFYLIGTLFAFYLVLKLDPEEIISIVMIVGAFLAVFGLILVIFFPQYGISYSARDGWAWHGVFGDRSAAAKTLVFFLSPALTLRRRPFRYHHLAYIALMSLMIFMAHAMTARVVLFAYVIFMALVRTFLSFGRRSAFLICGMLLAISLLIACASLPLLPQILHGIGRSITLTGRTGIWAAVARAIGKRPFLGYGYYAFWQGLKGESASLIIGSHWVFGYAHNGILEIGLQLGILGVAVFFLTLLQAIGNAWYCLRNGCPPGVEWYIGLVALTIMYNIDESTVLWPIDLLSILYVLACCGLAIAARRLRFHKTMEALYS
jgi:exopolysaccharide production protein ExoQ